MSYDKIIEESVINLLTIFNKLESKDKNFAISQLNKIINHVNRTEKQRKNSIEKFKNVGHERYDDTLDFLIDVVGLMGYTELELNYYLRDDFVLWFRKYALENPKYQAKNITTNILQSFGQAYRMYKMEYDREPESYIELRNFVLNFDDILNEMLTKQINELCND